MMCALKSLLYATAAVFVLVAPAFAQQNPNPTYASTGIQTTLPNPGKLPGLPGGFALFNDPRITFPTGDHDIASLGDSITRNALGYGVTYGVTGGTGPYTFNITYPASAALATGVSSFTVETNGQLPGTYVFPVNITDSAGNAFNQNFQMVVSEDGYETVMPVGTPTTTGTATLTVAQSGVIEAESSRGALWWVDFLDGQASITKRSEIFGYPGQTSGYLLSRLSQIIAACGSCGAYRVMIGTNDDTLAGDTLAGSEANITAIYTQLLATAKPVFLSVVLPKQALSQATIDYVNGLEQWERKLQGTVQGLYVDDGSGVYAQPTSTTMLPIAGATSDYNYSIDGVLHPSTLGSYYISRNLQSEINLIYPFLGYAPASLDDAYSATQPLGNLLPGDGAVMSFSNSQSSVTGRASGSTPNGWTVETIDGGDTSTDTLVASQGTMPDGFPSLHLVDSGTAVKGYETLRLAVYNFSSGQRGQLAAGMKLSASCRISVAAGSAHVSAPTLAMVYTVNGVTYQEISGGYANGVGESNPNMVDAGPTTAYSGVLAIHPEPYDALQGTPSSFSLHVGFAVTAQTSATVGVTADISQCAIRAVQ